MILTITSGTAWLPEYAQLYLIDAALHHPLLSPRRARGHVGVESLGGVAGHDGHRARPVSVGRQVDVKAALVVAVVAAHDAVAFPAGLEDEFSILWMKPSS